VESGGTRDADEAGAWGEGRGAEDHPGADLAEGRRGGRGGRVGPISGLRRRWRSGFARWRTCVAVVSRRGWKQPSRIDPGPMRKLDGVGEAKLIALSCSEPPSGRTRWTLELLGDALVALKVTDSISYETVRRTLKKTS